MTRISATVYLIHFERALHHARHYVGYTAMESVEARLARHRDGRGARLLAACNAAGIGYEIVRVWPFGDIPSAKAQEKRLKRAGRNPDRCPVCRAAAKAKVAS